MAVRAKTILDLIGHTPMVPIQRLNPKPGVEILAKLEAFNPGGSIKDRPALFMIEEAIRTGALTHGKVILEATSGNTGIGLALVAAVKGFRILLSMSEAASAERVKILKAMGADIHFTPARLGTDGAIEFVYSLVREHPEQYWLADQFNNPANWQAHYETTAPEIWEQTEGRLDVLVATMGTTGTLMGLSRRLKEFDPRIRIVGVEPYEGHKLQGLKNMQESYRPGIYDRRRLDEVLHVDDDEAYEMARRLAREEGIFCGMSSGAAMAGALQLAQALPAGRIVVILPDGGERYLSTALFASRRKSGLKVFNTLSRSLEEFVPIKEKQVGIYSCGPTLCEHIHLAHCRRFAVADLARRYLEYKGFKVTLVMNLTDLDDRTIRGAEAAGAALAEFTEGFFQAFQEDMAHLRIKEASAYPRASAHVPEMIELAHRLMEKGYAYEKFRSIYFDISRFKPYGKLSRIDLDKMQLGKTVDLEQYGKDNPRDFTLLKRSTLNELKQGIFYQTQWGKIRPSWHIECPAMGLKYLGDTYDIHVSSMDLIFPHHENVIAICEALNNLPPVNYWMHSELVAAAGDTSGTEGRLTLRDLLAKGYTGAEIRYWLLSRHYRKPVAFAHDKLDAARNTLAHLNRFIQKVHGARQAPDNPETDQMLYDLRHGFAASMDNDLHISGALAVLFQFVRRINLVMDRLGLSSGDRQKVLDELERINTVLAVMDLEPILPEARITELILTRDKARRAKDWTAADRIRDELQAMGIEVIDTPQGPLWQKS